MNLLSALTEEQLQAVNAPPGVNLVLAIPGSGKTAVFVHRIAHLIETGTKPENILALTFARKAAREIASRLAELVPAHASRVTVGTFHSVCYRILKGEYDFTVIDDDEKIRIMKRICTPVLKPDIDIGEIIRTISLAKNNLVDAVAYREHAKDQDEMKLADVYELYEQALQDDGKIDMDDLLLRSFQLLSYRPDILGVYQKRFVHLLCDEAQDNNKVQAGLLSLLASTNENLFLCGDDDQSIHNFRGASAEYILKLEDVYPAVNKYLLTTNFRSTGAILEAAGNLIQHNTVRYSKELKTENEYGSEVQIIKAADEQDEARIIADEIETLIRSGDCAYSDIAILYRMNSQSLPFEDIMPVRGIPYEIVGGNEFYSRREISTLVYYLRLVHDLEDDEAMLAILDIPTRYLGGSVKTEIKDFAQANEVSCHQSMRAMRFARMYQGRNVKELLASLAYIRSMPPSLTVGDIILEIRAVFTLDSYFKADEIATEDNSRIQNMDEFMKKASEFNKLESFLEYVKTRQDRHSANGGVKLQTVHASKGLEYSVVFLIALNEGILPHQKSITQNLIEEERRLAYVAMTRAKHRLYMSHRLNQDNKVLEPSRFLNEALPNPK